jgi:phosphate transport system ATP-binding protein
VLEAYGLCVGSGNRAILRDINLVIEPNRVLGIIGPSGVGKSTLLRCLNRMTDLIPGLRVDGEILWHGQPIHARGVDPDALRARVGMIFQQPVVFPGSILDNVVFGSRRVLGLRKRHWHETAERVLREVCLWDEVHDRLGHAATELSVGQQQRLCLARTLALEPEVVLMDEPTSALDPASTEAIEQLILQLRRTCAVVLVTHDLEQAQRVTDAVACLCLQDGAGQLVEQACCADVFANPDCQAVAKNIAEHPPEKGQP